RRGPLQRPRASVSLVTRAHRGRHHQDAGAHRRGTFRMTATKTTLPARYYTDPTVFVRERERFHADMWVNVAREEDVAKPGDFVVRDVAGESVIITRDDSGALQAFYNVCRHRGTRICGEEKGKFTGRIQCPYHAWTYALDGRLVAAPHMDDSPGFRC